MAEKQRAIYQKKGGENYTSGEEQQVLLGWTRMLQIQGCNAAYWGVTPVATDQGLAQEEYQPEGQSPHCGAFTSMRSIHLTLKHLPHRGASLSRWSI